MLSIDVYLKKSMMPGARALQVALDQLQLGVQLSQHDPLPAGFWPCKISTLGSESGFEFYNEKFVRPPDLDDEIRTYLHGQDWWCSHMFPYNDPSRELCAYAVAAGLVGKFGGVATVEGEPVDLACLVYQVGRCLTEIRKSGSKGS